MKFNYLMPVSIISMLMSLGLSLTVNADTTKVRCDFYPIGEDKATDSDVCTFSQRQGYVRIQKKDGTSYSFAPDDDKPNDYTDGNGDNVIRELDGDRGLIFRTKKESIFIYWDTSLYDSQANQSGDPKTYTTVQDFNNIAIQIEEGEFVFSGILKRDSGKEFVGDDGRVRVFLNPYDGHVTILNSVTGTEFYNYYISPVSGVGEDPDTMCDIETEPC